MTPPASPAAPRTRGRAGTVFQLGGFIVGLGLLAWCVNKALAPENREQLDRLREAPPALVASLLALSLSTILLNGLIFRVIIGPVRRLKTLDVLAVNALASFLNYLPFKLSLVSRILIHHRRDRLPVFVIGAWLTAMGILILVALGPLVLATVIVGALSAPWFAIAGASLVAAMLATILLARSFEGAPGLDRVYAIVDAARLPLVSRFFRAGFIRDLHATLTMLASPPAVLGATTLRLADTLVQAARFSIAATILGQNIGLDSALIFSITYFAIGILSPVGMLGFREMGTAAAAGLGGGIDAESFVVIPLLIGATEAMVNLIAAGAGVAWLRPGRLLFRSAQEPGPTARG